MCFSYSLLKLWKQHKPPSPHPQKKAKIEREMITVGWGTCFSHPLGQRQSGWENVASFLVVPLIVFPPLHMNHYSFPLKIYVETLLFSRYCSSLLCLTYQSFKHCFIHVDTLQCQGKNLSIAKRQDFFSPKFLYFHWSLGTISIRDCIIQLPEASTNECHKYSLFVVPKLN